MRAKSLTVGLVSIALAVVGARHASAEPTTPTDDATSRTLLAIGQIAELRSLAPGAVRQQLHARVALQQSMWTTEPGLKWVLYYQVAGNLGLLKPDAMRMGQAKPSEVENRQAYISWRITLNSQSICITPAQLQASFPGKLADPPPLERPYVYDAPQPYYLKYKNTSGPFVLFSFHNCLDEININDNGSISRDDGELKRFEIIDQPINLDEAKSKILNDGFSCDPTLTRAAQPNEYSFQCTKNLNNDGDFKSESAQIFYSQDTNTLTGVILVKWKAPNP